VHTNPDDHSHMVFQLDVPDDSRGFLIDYRLLSRLVNAAFDMCQACQDDLVTRISLDGPSAAQLVELACVAVNEVWGGLPPDFTEDDQELMVSPEFRRLARVGSGGHNDAMFAECGKMTPAERKAAIESSAAILAGGHAMLVRLGYGHLST
jgi:hypothetical protein